MNYESVAGDKAKASWLGLALGDFVIEKLLGESQFSTVYLGTNRMTGEHKAFKVAAPDNQVWSSRRFKTKYFPTQALTRITGAFTYARPCTAELLRRQAEKMLSTNNPHIVRISNWRTMGVYTYYESEFLCGETLEEKIAHEGADLLFLVELARALDHVQKDKDFCYHGDLKPENIFVTASGIILIDPGFFGVIATGQRRANISVTTPAFYPLLEPDDMLAFGLLAWLVLTGQHPLATTRSSAEIKNRGLIDRALFETIRSRELGGNYFSSGLLFLKHPTNINAQLDSKLGDVLLKLLRLRLDDSRLYADPGYRDFDEIIDALVQHL